MLNDMDVLFFLDPIELV